MAVPPYMTEKIENFFKFIEDKELYERQLASNNSFKTVRRSYVSKTAESVKNRSEETTWNNYRIILYGSKESQVTVQIAGIFRFWLTVNAIVVMNHQEKVFDSKSIFYIDNDLNLRNLTEATNIYNVVRETKSFIIKTTSLTLLSFETSKKKFKLPFT